MEETPARCLHFHLRERLYSLPPPPSDVCQPPSCCLFPPPPPPHSPSCLPTQVLRPTRSLEVVSDLGGLSNTGYELHRAYPHAKVGTLVAGNSGRPGGGCGMADGTVKSLHAYHKTQVGGNSDGGRGVSRGLQMRQGAAARRGATSACCWSLRKRTSSPTGCSLRQKAEGERLPPRSTDKRSAGSGGWYTRESDAPTPPFSFSWPLRSRRWL